jgi:hypothetical protein
MVKSALAVSIPAPGHGFMASPTMIKGGSRIWKMEDPIFWDQKLNADNFG